MTGSSDGLIRQWSIDGTLVKVGTPLEEEDRGDFWRLSEIDGVIVSTGNLCSI